MNQGDDLLTQAPQYGAMCQFLLRKEVVSKYDFNGGFGTVSAEFERKYSDDNCF